MAWHLLKPNDKRVPLLKPRGPPVLSFREGAVEAKSIFNEEEKKISSKFTGLIRYVSTVIIK